MSNSFGKIFTVSIFGESHSAGIGIVIDGVPAGFEIDMGEVKEALARRAPNKSRASTARKESDVPEILSGFIDGHATGTPLAAIIKNRDMRSSDYKTMETLMRPGHADYSGYKKYFGKNDIRGGGHFSGRITAPLVFAGNIAVQYLRVHGITIGSHISRLGGVEDDNFIDCSEKEFLTAQQSPLHVLNRDIEKQIEEVISETARTTDSIGGVIETAICGVPAGIGEPFFDSIESEISHMMFSVPAVKAVEFGAGFKISDMKGSESNDSLRVVNKEVVFSTNNNGGINGGISNGAPIIFRVAVKPTSSISLKQETINIETMENDEIIVKGRHDVTIVPRAVEVVKSAAAIVMMDLFLRRLCQCRS